MEKWKILIVDDEQDILDSTSRVFRSFIYNNLRTNLLFAKNLGEAKAELKSHPDISVVILDVILIPAENGLDLVSFIRNTLENKIMQIILRTGQPSDAPELDVLRNYDIREFLNKNETDHKRLQLSLLSALRSYEKEFAFQRCVDLEVDKRRLAEAEMIKTERLATVGQLSTGVCHEIGNSLTLITAGIDILNKIMRTHPEWDGLPLLTSAKQAIAEGKNRALKITSSLYYISRPEASRAWFSFKKIVEGAIALMVEKVKWEKIKIDIKVEDDVEILCDESSLMQVMHNLISNASDALQDHSGNLITISCVIDELEAVITVTDNGPGVATEIQSSIFEPFVTTKAPGKGVGLGLFIAKTQVEKNSGTITLDPSYTQGARFVLKYPQK